MKNTQNKNFVITSPEVVATLFENVRVFDGKSDELSEPSNVLMVANKIQAISASSVTPPDGAQVTRVAGDGRTLMPGLIDAHTHLEVMGISQVALLTADIVFASIVAAKMAENMLMRGFTSARDLMGNVFGLKRAIDAGVVNGPRIWPAGAAISQSGGHGDFRNPTSMPTRPCQTSYQEIQGFAVIANGTAEVLQRAREQLALGASQLKLMAGGGVCSMYDPLNVTEFTLEEMRAGVQAAENWGTYVTVHAITSQAVRQALDAGVKCIEHAFLVDEETVKLMADKDVWWCLQPFLDDDDAPVFMDPILTAKYLQVVKGTDNSYKLAKKYKIKTSFGSDILFDPKLAERQGKILAKLTNWYTPFEVLNMATAVNAELLAMSGPRNPYPGKLGVVEEGALADVLLVDGNPLENIQLITDPANNLIVIMKDGKIYKNLAKTAG